MKIINQECDSSCVVACIAMVAGVPFSHVIENHNPSIPMGSLEMETILVKYGILPRRTSDLILGHLYIVDTPSLNSFGLMHAVVIKAEMNDTFKVYDPMNGRKGRDFYFEDGSNFTYWNNFIQIIYT